MAYGVSPSFLAAAFNCPLCGAYSRHIWLKAPGSDPTGAVIDGKELAVAQCTRCNKLTYWLDGKMSHPPQEDRNV
jgi:transcription elongation factor Elf1